MLTEKQKRQAVPARLRESLGKALDVGVGGPVKEQMPYAGDFEKIAGGVESLKRQADKDNKSLKRLGDGLKGMVDDLLQDKD